MTNINGSYGKFVISKTGKSSFFPVEVRAKHFYNVFATIEAAINYLVGRFGHDVIYEVK